MSKSPKFSKIFFNVFSGETAFCWVFSISSMLQQSLKIFITTLLPTSRTQAALQKLQENEFHKRFRNELIMLPIPKAIFSYQKVPKGVNRDDFKAKITQKQTHVLESAISRVSLNQRCYQKSKRFYSACESFSFGR